MDPISQAALGAAVGHVCFHRQLGMKAAGLGAIAGMCPDLDVPWGTLEGPFSRLVSHRGITHSLFFGPVIGTVWGWWYWWRRTRAGTDDPRQGPWFWSALFALALLSHPLLDLFTHYGTQLLAPFSRQRFALPAVPILEPIYTSTLGFGLLGAAIITRRPHIAHRAGWFTGIALVLTTAYLFAGLHLNGRAEAVARQQLAAIGVNSVEVHAFPTMMQLPYRRLVAFTEDEVRVGFVSTWRSCPIEWAVAPRLRNELIDRLKATREGEIFAWFAAGLLSTTVEPVGELTALELSDLRYGFDLDARRGLWGIRGYFNNAGELQGSPEYVRKRPAVNRTNIARLFGAAFPRDCGPHPTFE
ncbi:MAG: metal-dependent hydrolase [Gammaproteobacteria bacterium]|nr:metal-dependent hydrolase [Gammaproteobacteria bacterium]